MKSILESIEEAGNFNKFREVIRIVGLEEKLKGEGPFTVFAPTDEAFEKIPSENLQTILSDSQMLPHVADYHIVRGKYSSEDLRNQKREFLETIEGSRVIIYISPEGKVQVDEAKIVQPDVECSNGVCHGIDAVLMPTLSQAFQAYAR